MNKSIYTDRGDVIATCVLISVRIHTANGITLPLSHNVIKLLWLLLYRFIERFCLSVEFMYVAYVDHVRMCTMYMYMYVRWCTSVWCTHVSVHTYVYLWYVVCTCMHVRVCVCVFLCLSVCLSVCLFVCVCVSVYLVCACMRLPLRIATVCLSLIVIQQL